MDELIGQAATAPPWLAFKTDSIGANQPLISESLIADNIWQAGEVWEFVLQAYWPWRWLRSVLARPRPGLGSGFPWTWPHPDSLRSGCPIRVPL